MTTLSEYHKVNSNWKLATHKIRILTYVHICNLLTSFQYNLTSKFLVHDKILLHHNLIIKDQDILPHNYSVSQLSNWSKLQSSPWQYSLSVTLWITCDPQIRSESRKYFHTECHPVSKDSILPLQFPTNYSVSQLSNWSKLQSSP
jgi:hypothetical protein